MSRRLAVRPALALFTLTAAAFGLTPAVGATGPSAGARTVDAATSIEATDDGLPWITPPPDPSQPVAQQMEFAVIGDYGGCGVDNCEGEQAVADLVHSWNPDAILTVGDNTYQQGLPEEIVKAQAPYKADIDAGIFYPIMGNHDYGNGCNPESIQPSVDYFGVPVAYAAGFGNGLLDFLNPDANCNTSSGSTMPPIFDGYLASVQGSTAAWTLSGSHQPVYSSGKAGNNLDRRWLLQPGVDLVLSGHDHDMEHITTSDGYNIGVIGSSGNGTTPIFSPVDGSLFRDDEHLGALRMTVTPDQLHAEYVSTTGEQLYYFTLRKDAEGRAYVADRSPWTDPNPPMPPSVPNQPDIAFDTAVDSADGLTWQDYEDGPAEDVAVDGLHAVQLLRNPFGGANQLYLHADDDAISGGPYNATATVVYRSPEAGSFRLQYDSAATGSAYQRSADVTIGAGQVDTWLTATIDLPQVRFTNRQNGGADMRLGASANLPLLVRCVAIHVKPPVPLAPEVSLGFEEDEPEGISYLPYESGPAHLVTVDGRPAWQVDRNTFNSGNNFYLTVDDRMVSGGPFDAVATIDYRSPVAGSWVLQYDSAATGSAYQSAQRITIGPDQVDTWLQADIEVPQARFNNRQNGGADMRIVGANNLPYLIAGIQLTFGETPLSRARAGVTAAEAIPTAATIATARQAVDVLLEGSDKATLADRLGHVEHTVDAAELLARVLNDSALSDTGTPPADLYDAVDAGIADRTRARDLIAGLSGPVTETALVRRLPDDVVSARERLVAAAIRWLAPTPTSSPPQVSDAWLDLLAEDLVADEIDAGTDPDALQVDDLLDRLQPTIREHATGARVEAALIRAIDTARQAAEG